MVENSDLPGSVSGTRPPGRLTEIPQAPEDNARRRFELERERRRAEKSRKDGKDPEGGPRDRWDGPEEGGGEPASPPPSGQGARTPREEGGLDVVA
jgi:hypothetical protein